MPCWPSCCSSGSTCSPSASSRPVGAAVYAIRNRYPEAVAGQLVGLAFVTTVGLVAGVLHQRRTEQRGCRVSCSTARSTPRLWAEVRALAESSAPGAPDEIRLLPEVNAAVEEQTQMLGLVRGRRTLYLGAPVLMGLTARRSTPRSSLTSWGTTATATPRSAR